MARRRVAAVVGCVAGLGLWWSSNFVAAQAVVLESAVLGGTGRIGGASVAKSQFIGWRFSIDQPLSVERVGGHLLGFPDAPGGIFAALVRLESIDSVPLGAPFTDEEVLATTTFEPPFPSDEILVPLAATLLPGSYTLVFGTGLFGATGAGALHNGDDQPDIPPTDLSSFIFWSVPREGAPFEWRLNLASHMRFVIEAELLHVPGDYDGDFDVDDDDYTAWQADFGSTTSLAADGSENGIVDAADYVIWRKNTEAEPTGAAAMRAAPEPTTVTSLVGAVTLLGTGLFGGGRFRGRTQLVRDGNQR